MNLTRKSKLILLLVIGLFVPNFLLPNKASCQDSFSDFVNHLPKSNTEVMAVNNLAGHLETALSNRALQRVLTEGTLAQRTGGALDPNVGLQWIDDNRMYFPETIVISGTDSIYATMGGYFQTMFLLNMPAVLAEAGVAPPDDEVERLETELLQAIEDFEIPNAVVWTEWEDEDIPKMLFQMFSGQAGVYLSQTDLEINQQEGICEISGEVRDVVPDVQVAMFLDLMAIGNSDEVAEKLGDLSITLKIEQIDRGIRLTIGEASYSETLAKNDLPGITDGNEQIVYGAWDVSRMLEEGDKFDKQMQAWEETETVQEFRRHDIEDLWGTYRSFISQVRDLPTKGQMRLWTEPGMIRVNLDQQGITEAPSLVGDGILSKIPKESEIVYLSSATSLPKMLVRALEGVEDRMATQDLRASLTGDASGSEVSENMISGYYRFLGPMRKVIFEKLVNVDAKPAAIVVDTQGELDLFIDSVELQHEIEIDGLRNFPEFACIAKVDDESEILELADELYMALVQGLLDGLEIDRSDDLGLIKKADLGLGVETRQWTFDWLSELEIAEVHIDGDFVPHYFIHDGYFVFSTSPMLSKKLVATDRESLQLASSSHIVGYGQMSGESIGNLYATLLNVMFSSVSQALGYGDRMVDPMLSGMVDGLVEVASLMKICRWETTQSSDRQITDIVFEFENR